MKSKLLLLFVLSLFLTSTQANAQHIVRFSPFSLIKAKAKFHYEYGTGKIGLGVIAAGYFGLYPGVRIQPFMRYYITDNALNGLYIQPKIHFSINTFETFEYDVNLVETTVKSPINEFGGAINLGWQFLLGSNKNIVIDVFTGYRFSNLQNSTATSMLGGDDSGSESLYAILHSNQFDLGLSFGFKF